MKLFFDTETSDLPKWNAPPDDPAQPHLVQLAALLMDDDGVERNHFNAIIKPDGWVISEGAAAIHKKTTEIAVRDGIPLLGALILFKAFCCTATELIAHNLSFDLLIMQAALLRVGSDSRQMESLRRSCTMHESTNVLQLPGRRGQYKWPKLEEAYRHFYGKDFDGAHDALADVRACAAVHFALLGKPLALPAPASTPPLAPVLAGTEHLLKGYSWHQVSQCLDRELRFRRKTFPSRVLKGDMQAVNADHEIELMSIAKLAVDTMVNGEEFALN